jgi:hypothetical protein
VKGPRARNSVKLARKPVRPRKVALRPARTQVPSLKHIVFRKDGGISLGTEDQAYQAEREHLEFLDAVDRVRWQREYVAYLNRSKAQTKRGGSTLESVLDAYAAVAKDNVPKSKRADAIVKLLARRQPPILISPGHVRRLLRENVHP